jgi:hypothetical protein
MRQRTYSLVCAAIFLVVACAHLLRLVFRWPIAIGGWLVPLWISIPGLLVTGLLSAWGFRLASGARTTP